MQRPIRGAQRRIEARIGQLLGMAKWGGDRKSYQVDHDRLDALTDWVQGANDRRDFRYLARALGGECEITADEWRKSRRSLVSLIRRRLGAEMPEEPAAAARQVRLHRR